jgi:hypothetical protein
MHLARRRSMLTSTEINGTAAGQSKNQHQICGRTKCAKARLAIQASRGLLASSAQPWLGGGYLATRRRDSEPTLQGASSVLSTRFFRIACHRPRKCFREHLVPVRAPPSCR